MNLSPIPFPPNLLPETENVKNTYIIFNTLSGSIREEL